MAKIFCMDGVVVEIPQEEVEKRLPYDIMTLDQQPTMVKVLEAQGKQVDFLSAVPSFMLLKDVPGATVENINKPTVNGVAEEFGYDHVYGPDDDGILDPYDRDQWV